MEKDKVKEMLEFRFRGTPIYPKKRHIIFWYDEEKAFLDVIENLNLENVKVIRLKKSVNRHGENILTNIFKTKYTLEISDPNSNYLIYADFARPTKQENYLLDIENYSEYFEADKSALLIEELGLDRRDDKLQYVIKKYISFFANKERKEKFKKLIDTNKKMTEKEVELVILAVLSGSKTIEFTEILKNIIIHPSKLEQIEKWMSFSFLWKEMEKKFYIDIKTWEEFLKILLVVYFYGQLHMNPSPMLEKYYIGKKNELFVFVSSLLQNKESSEAIRVIFQELGHALQITDRIDELELENMILGNSFEYFDEKVIYEIVERLNSNLQEYDSYRKMIQIRLDNTLWKEKYFYFYNALLATIEIFECKETLDIKNRKTLQELKKDYVEEYYKIDQNYRKFYYSYDKIKSFELACVFDSLDSAIGHFYEVKYLEILLEVWNQHLSEKDSLDQQKDFYKNFIMPLDTRVAVIISDALRYEVGEEIMSILQKEGNTKKITLSSLLTDLPSITSIGMTNLLPSGKEKIIDIPNQKMSIDGIPTFSTENREKILKEQCRESSAISYDSFNNKNRSEQEEYVKGKKVLYFYHDTIDAIGDKGKTEHRTFEGCETAIQDIVGLTKILSSLGVVHIFITSDHGFLYERKEMEEYNKLELQYENYLLIGKRYAFAKHDTQEKGCVSLKMGEELCGIFPTKNQRIKVSGSGLQFVHGGSSPQEMIIPCIHYHGGNKIKKTSKVTVKIKEIGNKITSNLSKFSIYQLDAVDPKQKIFERTIVAALYYGNNQISNEYKVLLNGIEQNTEYRFPLTLSGEYDKVTLKVFDAESQDLLDFKEYEVKIGIISDFDF